MKVMKYVEILLVSIKSVLKVDSSFNVARLWQIQKGGFWKAAANLRGEGHGPRREKGLVSVCSCAELG